MNTALKRFLRQVQTPRNRVVSILIAAGLATVAVAGSAAETAAQGLLWEIGTRDNSFSEFALAPKKYAEYKQDGLFVVGQSEPRKDWPYVQPGPADGWAGAKPHRFMILFDIEKAAEGTSKLTLDLVDTQAGSGPQLDIRVNGHSFTCSLPTGSGDATINGDPRGGKEHVLEVPIPAGWLKAGTNEISIDSTGGSWMLYDWIGFEGPAGTETGPVKEACGAQAPVQTPALVKRDDKLCALMRMEVFYAGDGPKEALVKAGEMEQAVTLTPGKHAVDVFVPASSIEQKMTVQLVVDGAVAASNEAVVKPVRKWKVYLFPHSHVDIGYTHVQTEVEQKHKEYFRQALKASLDTKDYPHGSQFKWNSEVEWPVINYMKTATTAEREELLEAVRKGWFEFDGLHANQLTALSRPEELVRLTSYACMLRDTYKVPIDTAMISDVPGYTWGMVPVLAQSGIKYWSIGPNGGDRIGHTLAAWADRPFYWVSPSGREKVLVWVAGYGYSAFHRAGLSDGERLFNYLLELEQKEFPYDMVHMRYSVGGDNGPPDVALCEVVRDWNERFAYPRIYIATAGEFFREFEQQYGDQVPSASGDFTPYWEDGAASSAAETALTRDTNERLTQAEALWAMLKPEVKCPRETFDSAWVNAIMYNEHTWGAHNSISQPDEDFVKQQWAIKQAFALDAARMADVLLQTATGRRFGGTCSSACCAGSDPAAGLAKLEAVMVHNTNSWSRDGFVTIPALWPRAGDWVVDDGGDSVLSQRLTTGELAFMAKDIPPFGSRKFYIHAGEANKAGSAQASESSVQNDHISVAVDTSTGAISSITCNKNNRQVVPAGLASGSANAYWYVPGKDPSGAVTTNEPPTISIKENGPLVASLLVESKAPGCRKLTREIRLVSGMDRVDIINTVDKEKVRTKEGVHFEFNFDVPDGVMRMDTPWAVVRPEFDQMPGSCKNWFTVQRWVDISNQENGVTWATVDAPLVEVGAITAETPWMTRIEPSQRLYSYVMNNYWHTNYKADQEGPTVFRYSIWPHGRFDSAAAARFGVEASQPLVISAVKPEAEVPAPLLKIEPAGVVATGVKISQDGKDFVVRLFGASGKPETASLKWRGEKQPQMWLSDLSEKPGERIEGAVEVPAWGMVTVRVDGQSGSVGTKELAQ